MLHHQAGRVSALLVVALLVLAGTVVAGAPRERLLVPAGAPGASSAPADAPGGSSASGDAGGSRAPGRDAGASPDAGDSAGRTPSASGNAPGGAPATLAPAVAPQVDAASVYPVLVGAGDIASCSLTADTATARVVAGIPGTVFAAGDLAYNSGTAAEFRNCYQPAWGAFKARTRPAPGNHEYVTAGAKPYFAYFGSAAGTPGKGWYAYDVGTWRVYALNSNCASIGGCGHDSPQGTWLRADLAAHPRTCVAAYWHHPLFSSGEHGATTAVRPLWRMLQRRGADLVLTGHDHDYERFSPQLADGTRSAAGMREFVVGTGGATTRAFARIAPHSVVRKTRVHGVLRLELKPGGYTWRFMPVAGQTWSDSGSASCH